MHTLLILSTVMNLSQPRARARVLLLPHSKSLRKEAKDCRCVTEALKASMALLHVLSLTACMQHSEPCSTCPFDSPFSFVFFVENIPIF
jgi:hypothetical protein